MKTKREWLAAERTVDRLGNGNTSCNNIIIIRVHYTSNEFAAPRGPTQNICAAVE